MTQTLMAKEARQTPELMAQQLVNNQTKCEDIVNAIQAFQPEYVFIIGRGSSDHAGVFAKYLIEVELGIPVCSSAPSVFSVFDRTLNLSKALVLVISQSGGSPDIIAQTKAARQSGAMTVGLINVPNSRLSKELDAELSIGAGEENAVAATKSYLLTLSALAHLVACWNRDDTLLTNLKTLPDIMPQVFSLPSTIHPAHMATIKHCVILGRGFGYAVSREMALKMKEVLSVHAEAFSSAEFLHGPVTLTNSQLQTFSINVADESEVLHQEIIKDVTGRGSVPIDLTTVLPGVHKRLSVLVSMLKFYIDLEAAARTLNKDPDNPPGLNKVTKTN